MMVAGGIHGGKEIPTLYQGETLLDIMLRDMEPLGAIYLQG
jgi:hypothetical protein